MHENKTKKKQITREEFKRESIKKYSYHSTLLFTWMNKSFQSMSGSNTVKTLLSPLGAYLIWALQRGLIREGGLFKLAEKDIYVIDLSVFYLIFCRFHIQFYESNT